MADRGFATPIVDEKAEAEKKKQEQFAAEKEAIIKEYDERMKKKGKDVKKKGELAQIAEEEKDQKVWILEVAFNCGFIVPLLENGLTTSF